MPAFPSFTNTDFNDIFAYIEDADKPCYYPAPPQSDSCEYYCAILDLASEIDDENDFITITDSLVSTGSSQLFPNIDVTDTIPDPTFATFTTLITPKFNKSYYYTVDINRFGWYNLDKVLDTDGDILVSELSVNIPEKEDQSISVFLVIPSHKIMVEGGYLKDGKRYGFYEEDGSITLPQGVKAYIIAIGENKNKPELYFGSTAFITSEKQELHLTLDISSEKDIQEQIAGLQLPDFLSKASKKEVSAKMQALEQEAVRIQAKTVSEYCDCAVYEAYKQ